MACCQNIDLEYFWNFLSISETKKLEKGKKQKKMEKTNKHREVKL